MSLLEPILLTFIPQVSLRTSQIHNLWTPISIFLHLSTFLAVVSIRDPRSTADGASPLEASEVAFITYLDKSAWSHIRVTDHTFTVTFFTETANSNSRLFSAEDQVGMMFCHILKYYSYYVMISNSFNNGNKGMNI